jgi:hypothetical protein
MGPLIEKAGMDLASAIGADQVLAWGRLTSQGQMESLAGSDLRVEGFVWVVRPDGELGTSPPGQLAVFLIAQHEQGLKERRWYGIEIDPKGLERAFPNPLPGGRGILHDAEQLYAETMPKLAPLVEPEQATPSLQVEPQLPPESEPEPESESEPEPEPKPPKGRAQRDKLEAAVTEWLLAGKTKPGPNGKPHLIADAGRYWQAAHNEFPALSKNGLWRALTAARKALGRVRRSPSPKRPPEAKRRPQR